jgi:hypothetical protein
MTLKHNYIPTKHQQTPHRDQLPKPSKNKTGQAKSLSHTQTHMNTHTSKAKQSKKGSEVGAKTNLIIDCFFFLYQSKWKKDQKRLKVKLCRLEGVRERGRERGKGRERKGSSPKYH